MLTACALVGTITLTDEDFSQVKTTHFQSKFSLILTGHDIRQRLFHIPSTHNISKCIFPIKTLYIRWNTCLQTEWNITSDFNMLHQYALLTAAQSNKTHGLRFTGDSNNSELCDVWRHFKLSQADKIVYLCFCHYVRIDATNSVYND